MKLDQLKAFISVAETGSFRSAVHVLNRTQPSISAAVKLLEEQFNVALFDRSGYRPVLTNEGQEFFRQAKQLLSQVQQLENLGHDLAKGIQIPLHVCLAPACLNSLMIAKLKEFKQLNQDISLDISTQHMYGIKEQLQRENAEIESSDSD